MSRALRWLALVVILVAGFSFWSFHTYHPGGITAIAAEKGLSPAQRVVRAAVTLRGIPYDYAGGRLLGRGLLVCADVPRLAYRAAGIDLAQLMAEDYSLHPANYAAFPGNDPSTPYFARRVANQKVFFQDTGRLIRNCTAPEPGDTVFYGTSHVTMVVAVYPDHTWDEIETSPQTVVVIIHRHKGWVPRDVGRFARLTGA